MKQMIKYMIQSKITFMAIMRDCDHLTQYQTIDKPITEIILKLHLWQEVLCL